MQIGGRGHFQCAIDQDHPIFAAEAEVSKKHIDLLALQHVHRTSNIGGDVHVVIVLEQTPQPVARMLLVVDDQDSGLDIHGNCESQMLNARFLLSIKFAPMTKHE